MAAMNTHSITIGCHAYRELPFHPAQMTEEEFNLFAARRPSGMDYETARVLMNCKAIEIAKRGGRYWNVVLMGQVLEALGWRRK